MSEEKNKVKNAYLRSNRQHFRMTHREVVPKYHIPCKPLFLFRATSSPQWKGNIVLGFFSSKIHLLEKRPLPN